MEYTLVEQCKPDIVAYDFNFSPYFPSTDTILSISVLSLPSGLQEVIDGRSTTGLLQTIMIYSGAAVDGKEYLVGCQAVSSSGLRQTLYKKILVLPEPTGIAAMAAMTSASGVYAAILAQSGTDDPTATVNLNTLSGTPVWARVSAGVYTATLEGAFPEGETRVFANVVPLQVGSESKAAGVRIDDDTIQVTVRDFADNPVDGFSVLYVDIQTFE